jgi:hypothetical protein
MLVHGYDRHNHRIDQTNSFLAQAVEELEDRLKEKGIEDILAHVRSSLKPRDSSISAPSQRTEVPIPQPAEEDWDAYLDVDGEGEEFDDTGEGTIIDGDLEMNDE